MRTKLALVLIGLSLGLADTALARKWTDRSGSFSVEAELVKIEGGKVHLKRADGKVIVVPEERLCDEDRQFLQSRTKPAGGGDSTGAPKKKPGGTTTRPRPNLPLKAGREAIEQELATRTRYAFNATPLRDVLAHFEETNQIPVFLDQRGLDNIGVKPDKPVTAKGEADSLAQAFDTLLKPLGATWCVRYDVLFVTSPAEAEHVLETRVYAVTPAKLKLDGLVQQITSKVAPKTWAAAGGPGTILGWPLGALVVTQTYAAHRQLGQQFGRTLKEVVPPEGKLGRRPVLGRPTLKDILGQPAVLEFTDTPLNTFVRQVAERNRIKVVLDEKALGEAGIGLDTPITCQLRGVKLQSELDLILHQLGLTWTVKENELLITTPAGEASRLLTIEYNVRDLIYAIEPPDADAVSRIIVNSVAPQSWSHAGGLGTLKAAEDGGALDIKQTFRLHLQVDRLISDIRLFGKM